MWTRLFAYYFVFMTTLLIIVKNKILSHYASAMFTKYYAFFCTLVKNLAIWTNLELEVDFIGN